ncbi:xaa-Arg dipeptidase-like isoform X2 [Seriola aureovittata]|uniref:xaa-Arg dipeptidase-like isoform X2 n=1 Tax=Seriola aureovittata TaxID=2871759 RepID=UPI0024BE2306|nr:xaa-Arg dipeptidase-like isoform X2 [Seriola aureovittata]
MVRRLMPQPTPGRESMHWMPRCCATTTSLDWRVHGIIKHGGVKPNIIPAYTELEYYLRTPSRSELPVLNAKAERCFRSAALATGCEVQVEFARNKFDNMLHNATLEELYERNGKALGMDFTTEEDVLSNKSGMI